MATFQGWEQQVLQDLGAPVTAASTTFLDAWASLEEPSANAGYENNPLNTKQPPPGSPYTGQVQDYSSPQLGAYETAATIANGFYPQLLANFKTGDPLSTGLQAVDQELHTWSGSGPQSYGVPKITAKEQQLGTGSGQTAPTPYPGGWFNPLNQWFPEAQAQSQGAPPGATNPINAVNTLFSNSTSLAFLIVGAGVILAALFLLKE